MSILSVLSNPFPHDPSVYSKINEFRGKVVRWCSEPNSCHILRKIATVVAMILASIVTLGVLPILMALASKKVTPFIAFTPTSEQKILNLQPRFHFRNDKVPFSLESLKKQDLLPKHGLSIGKVNYYCSDTFDYNGHQLVFALVEKDNAVYPRIFYHSNSQGTWRVLPYAKKNGQKVEWYGKGKIESDTQLPTALICALNNQHSVKKAQFPVSDLITTADYYGNVAKAKSTAEFIKQINVDMSLLDDESQYIPYQHPDDKSKPKLEIDPKDLAMPSDIRKWPNFKQKVEFPQTIPHYGDIKVSLFPSSDESLVYMFYEVVSDQRAFLANVESVKSDINDFGVRLEAIYVRGVDAPLMEYPSKLHCHPKDKKPPYLSNGTYQSNWNFVRELAIIQKYYSEHNKRMPDSV